MVSIAYIRSSYNGSTLVSKTRNVSSILTGRAKIYFLTKQYGSFSQSKSTRNNRLCRTSVRGVGFLSRYSYYNFTNHKMKEFYPHIHFIATIAVCSTLKLFFKELDFGSLVGGAALMVACLSYYKNKIL